VNPGAIVWVEFPGGAGRAQAGRRPAIVIQNADAIAKLPTILVVPLTTQQEALRFPGTILIEPSEVNGLRLPSVALIFQLTVVDKRFIGKEIGVLDEEYIGPLWAAWDDITKTDDDRE
jgi:mRNA interferase MazF